jgi:succinylglutamic semialdehyde dehydrogenase
MEACLDQPRKLLALEMGGKNIAVALEGAHIPQAVHELVLGACLTAGQRCTATSRLIVQRNIADELLDRLTRAFHRVKPGDPMEEGTLMGPLATMEARDWYSRELEKYEAGGVEPLVRSEALDGGAFVTPSIHRVSALDDNAASYLGTEFFAPNLAVQVVDDEATAMDICRQSAFGLSMSVFSGDRAVFERFAESVPCGLFNWNRSTNNASGLLPFGGLGYSGNHRSAGSTSALYCSRPVGVLERDLGVFDPDPVFGPVLDELIR